MESLFNVTPAATATSVAPAAVGKPEVLTLLHTQDNATEWVNPANGEPAGVVRPARAGVKALYGHPHEAFSVATSPTHLYQVVNTRNGDAHAAGTFDVGTGRFKTTGRESLVSLAIDAFGSPEAVGRIAGINPTLTSGTVPLAAGTLVKLYFER